MRYIWSHILTIIDTYKGETPLTHFLKKYFHQYPKLGSRDRRILSEMAYCWLRVSKGLDSSLPVEKRIELSLLLCSPLTKHLLPFISQDVEAYQSHSPAQRYQILKDDIQIEDIFPHSVALSEGISRPDWLLSLLTQPYVFIRIRKNADKIINILQEHQVAYHYITDSCLAITNGVSIDKLLPPDAYVIQDASSQLTGTYFHPQKNENWLDCCSGAGGKSLLLKDLEPTVSLSVSDVRNSILHNLEKRFQQYNHKVPATFCLDAAEPIQLGVQLGTKRFDAVICDVPCTGSGTWARTPEQMHFFDPQLLVSLPERQKKITTNIAQYIKKGGKLIYITCSVFRQENEEVVEHIAQQSGLSVETATLINGIHSKADSMYVAVLRK
jgi:16S rRNA (cytosine967-C5)-methyltransferase